ncbi:spherulation-specific family 4 protein [Candidatus Nitrosotalea okcheonensis]|uniref:spherulation-specific family 4 protein n=1 Tax=Candidatus Nitrosotalea okcheonensis TaxID=1903276 RepID=UPI001300033C|nr:spherulation-specific family 4 protein [Candidatus Nitrosotalea okcheonensis]
MTVIFLTAALSSPTINVDDTKTGILIPLYRHPDSTWDDLIQVKHAHPSVTIIAIVNPDNGPGFWDPTYVLGIKKLQSAGIPSLGYVYTSYGSRNSSEITADIGVYKNWYGVNGIFFDEMAHVPGKEGYYLHLNNYAKSLGLNFTVGNPGKDISPSYLGTVDNIVIYENSGLPSIELLTGWHTKYSKSNFSILSYGVDNLDEKFVQSASKHVGLIYITDKTLPNPWYSLTSYLDKLASLVASSSDSKKDLVSPMPAQNKQ